MRYYFFSKISDYIRDMCDKCNDIHTAQKEGRQDKPCSCVCHPVTTPNHQPYVNLWPTWTGTTDTGSITLDCNTFTGV